MAPPVSPAAPIEETPAPSSGGRAEGILAELEVFGVRLGLESTRALLAALSRPETRYPVVIVGGTNGKGSTSSLLASILDAAGLRVGLYTSPHLEDVAERVRVGGRVIASDVLADELERVVALGRRELGHPPTYFEALTVAAYAHFAAAAVEVAVMEVGLGGRLDATNAGEPVLSVITSIARDHVKVLGDTVDRIAREKAGILRPGRTAIHGVEPVAARAALEDEARRLGARLLDVRALTRCAEEPPVAAGRRRLRVTTPSAEHHLELGMLGRYQARNVATAALAAEVLAAELGLAVDAAAIERGTRAWRWPGRCELVTLPDGREVLLDAAHNEEGIASLRRELEGGAWPGAAGPGAPAGPARRERRWRLVFGALDDKPAAAMLREIAVGAERVVLLRPASPRAVDPGALAATLERERTVIAADAAAAIEEAFADGCRRAVVCGSIYLVGEMRSQLRRRFGVPAPAAAPWSGGSDGASAAPGGTALGVSPEDGSRTGG
jgi:dihydrofolate synthase/folylpolyglutamate synthase